jgi:putative ABC transport system permease protein
MRRRTTYQAFGFRSRVRGIELIRLAFTGLTTKPLRSVLSAVGIAIGIAAMVAVVGISASSQARINDQLSRLGTNLLTAEVIQPPAGEKITFPANVSDRIQRIPGVISSASTSNTSLNVYRSSLVPDEQSGGISVVVASRTLLDVVSGSMHSGAWFDEATERLPATILGSFAARQLGVTGPGGLVWLGGQNVKVVGILDPVPLAPELDSAALMGIPFTEDLLERDYSPVRVYERSTDESVGTVRTLIGPAALPESPRAVEVSRPSDALTAQAAVNETFTSLLLGLGSIALLVGGIGVANTMVIAVLERRREIGLRRALGATRHHVRSQFLAEALVLSALGGAGGAALGSAVCAIVAALNAWELVIPPFVLIAAVGATVVIGGIAGLYPAIRAARTPPTVALSI